MQIEIKRNRIGDESEADESMLIEYDIYVNNEYECSAYSTYGRDGYWCDVLSIEHCDTFNQLRKEVHQAIKDRNKPKDTGMHINRMWKRNKGK